jgi:hypothetical protein
MLMVLAGRSDRYCQTSSLGTRSQPRRRQGLSRASRSAARSSRPAQACGVSGCSAMGCRRRVRDASRGTTQQVATSRMRNSTASRVAPTLQLRSRPPHNSAMVTCRVRGRTEQPRRGWEPEALQGIFPCHMAAPLRPPALPPRNVSLGLHVGPWRRTNVCRATWALRPEQHRTVLLSVGASQHSALAHNSNRRYQHTALGKATPGPVRPRIGGPLAGGTAQPALPSPGEGRHGHRGQQG